MKDAESMSYFTDFFKVWFLTHVSMGKYLPVWALYTGFVVIILAYYDEWSTAYGDDGHPHFSVL